MLSALRCNAIKVQNYIFKFDFPKNFTPYITYYLLGIRYGVNTFAR